MMITGTATGLPQTEAGKLRALLASGAERVGCSRGATVARA